MFRRPTPLIRVTHDPDTGYGLVLEAGRRVEPLDGMITTPSVARAMAVRYHGIMVSRFGGRVNLVDDAGLAQAPSKYWNRATTERFDSLLTA